MKFDTKKFPPHTGICPMCSKSTKANVHQKCGLAREAELKARKKPRLTKRVLAEMSTTQANN